MEERQLFLVTFLVNVRHVRTDVPDQLRLRGLVSAKSEEHARQRFDPVANQLGFAFNLEPIEMIDLDKMGDFSATLRELCKRRDSVLAVVDSRSPGQPVPNCS